jgi:ribosomal protein L11 methyltransferase
LYPLRVPWLLIKFSVPQVQVPALSDALETCEALSVTIESATEEEQRLQSALEETALWSENWVAGLFSEDKNIDEVLNAVRMALASVEVPRHEVATLPDADWARAWMADYRPVQIASRLWVCPSWYTPPDPHAINLLLDPGLAFGTGTHPTTALCLRWLADRHWDKRSFIDYGCGSGILAIAALKLGAAQATGLDIDPQAIAVSRENAARNGVGERYQAGTPANVASDLTADVLVANILAGPLIDLAPEIVRHVKPSGLVALSGILTDQAEEVRRCYAPYVELQATQQEGWVLLAGQRLS